MSWLSAMGSQLNHVTSLFFIVSKYNLKSKRKIAPFEKGNQASLCFMIMINSFYKMQHVLLILLCETKEFFAVTQKIPEKNSRF